MARPPTYTADDERPVSVSLRLPKNLYDETQHYIGQCRMTLTGFLLDAIRLRLDTPEDPRDITVSQDNTVMQELQAMVDARIEAALAKEVGTLRDFLRLQAVPELPHDYNITVIHNEELFGDTHASHEAAVPPQRTQARPRGISEAQRAAIVAEYHRVGLPFEKFVVHLFDSGIYSATGRDGTKKPASTSTIHKVVREASAAATA